MKYIFYSGSLIQQNYGETVFKGFNIINLKNGDFEEKYIVNEYAFVNIFIIDNEFYVPLSNIGLNDLSEDIVIDNIKYLKWNSVKELFLRLNIRKLRVRIIYSKMEREIIDIFKEKELNGFEIIEFIEFFNNKNNSLIYENNQKENLDKEQVLTELNEKVINDLIEKYADKILKNYDENDLEKLKEINHYYIKNKKELVFNSQRFRLLELEFSNMFSYGENNYIDFTKINGITGIFAPNRMGKSSIPHIIIYMLFDKSPKIDKTIDILNNTKNEFYGKLKFLLNNEVYVIEKQGLANKSRTTVKVDINFYKVEKDNIINLNGEQRKETQKKIEEIIGSYEMFLLFHIYSSQYPSHNFRLLSQKDRRILLSKIYGIESYFNELYDESRIDKNVLTKEVKQYDIDNIKETIKALEKENEEYDRKINELIEDGKKVKEELSQNERIKEQYIRQLNDIDNSIIKINEEYLKQDILQLKNKNDNFKKENEINKKQIEILNTELQKKIKTFNNYNVEYIKNRIREIENLDNQIKEYERKLIAINGNISKYENYTAQAGKLKFDINHCEYCKTNYEIISNTNIEVKEKMRKLLIQKKDVENKLEGLKNERNKYTDIKIYYEKLRDYEKNKGEIEKIKGQIAAIEKKISDNIILIERNQRVIDKNEELIKKYVDNKDKIIKNNEIKELIDEREKIIMELKEKLENLRNEIYSYKSKIEINNQTINQLNDKIKEYYEKMEKLRIISMYNQLVSPSGIPLKIMGNIITVMEKMVNNIISGMAKFNVKFAMEKDKINLYIVENNKLRGAKLASGMEGFIIDIAFKVALSNISNYSKFSFMVIDEGWSALDKDNIHKSKEILEALKGYYDNIIVISHIDTMRDFVDNMLSINKDDTGLSKVL